MAELVGGLRAPLLFFQAPSEAEAARLKPAPVARSEETPTTNRQIQLIKPANSIQSVDRIHRSGRRRQQEDRQPQGSGSSRRPFGRCCSPRRKGSAKLAKSTIVILPIAIQFMAALTQQAVATGSERPEASKCQYQWARRPRLAWLEPRPAPVLGRPLGPTTGRPAGSPGASSDQDFGRLWRAKEGLVWEPADEPGRLRSGARSAPTTSEPPVESYPFDEPNNSNNNSSDKANLDDNTLANSDDETLGSGDSTSGFELEQAPNDKQTSGVAVCSRLDDVKAGIPSLTIRIVFFSLYGLIFAIGLIGNTLTLYAMRRKRRDRFSVIDIFIANLALSDIMLCLFAVPITPIYLLYHGYWVFGPILCKAFLFAQGSSVYISTFTMISIAHLRYQLIVHPLSDSMSKLTAFSLNLLTWILGFLVTLPYLMHVGLLPESCDIKFCDESWEPVTDRFWFSVITIILQLFLPFVAVSFFYGSIFWKLRQQRNLRRQKTAHKGPLEHALPVQQQHQVASKCKRGQASVEHLAGILMPSVGQVVQPRSQLARELHSAFEPDSAGQFSLMAEPARRNSIASGAIEDSNQTENNKLDSSSQNGPALQTIAISSVGIMASITVPDAASLEANLVGSSPTNSPNVIDESLSQNSTLSGFRRGPSWRQDQGRLKVAVGLVAAANQTGALAPPGVSIVEPEADPTRQLVTRGESPGAAESTQARGRRQIPVVQSGRASDKQRQKRKQQLQLQLIESLPRQLQQHHNQQQSHSMVGLRKVSASSQPGGGQNAGGSCGGLGGDILAMKEQRIRDKNKRLGQTNRKLLFMVVLFAFSWLPLNMFNLIQDYSETFSELPYHKHVFLIVHLISCSSVCYNPILYAWMSDNYRQELNDLMPRSNSLVGRCCALFRRTCCPPLTAAESGADRPAQPGGSRLARLLLGSCLFADEHPAPTKPANASARTSVASSTNSELDVPEVVAR